MSVLRQPWIQNNVPSRSVLSLCQDVLEFAGLMCVLTRV